MDAICAGASARMAPYRGVTVHRTTSVDAALRFPDSYFDWVYIDGDHSADAVAADLSAYWPKIKPGGFLSGDDYGWKDESDRLSVKHAVDEFAGSHGLKARIARDQFVLVRR